MNEAPFIQSLLSRIQAIQVRGSTRLVAIDGRGGSGKSTLAKHLAELDESFRILHVDWFPCRPGEHPFHPSGTQTYVNWERMRDEALLPLIQGKPAKFKETSWWPPLKESVREIPCGGTVLVEGCYCLRRELAPLYDLKIWMDAGIQDSVSRAILRDGTEMREIWENVYAPNETAYIMAHHPRESADIVIPGINRDNL